MQRRAPTPKQVFRGCVDKFKQHFPEVDLETFNPLERIANGDDDPRGVDVRDFVVSNPEQAGVFFFHLMWAFWLSCLSDWARGEAMLYDRHVNQKLRDIESAIVACEFLERFCLVRSNQFRFPLAAPIEYDTWNSLQRIRIGLQTEKQFQSAVDQILRDGGLRSPRFVSSIPTLGEEDGEGGPARSSTPRDEARKVFTTAMSAANCKIFGQPHDTVVAAAANVLFDSDVSAEAVKKSRRARRM